MSKIELQPDISNLESLNREALLTDGELSAYKKLPREEQKKQQEERLKKLEELQNKLRAVVEEANRTGKNVEEAKKLIENNKINLSDLNKSENETEVEIEKLMIERAEELSQEENKDEEN